jgi:ABC-type oligopeptide transport system substrate-binding subunit
MATQLVSPRLHALRLGIGLLFLVGAVSLWRGDDLAAQDNGKKTTKTDEKKGGKRVEVEDEVPPPVRKTITVPEEEGKTRPRRPAASGNLRLALDKTKHPEVKALFRALLTEHDEIVHKNNDPQGPNKIILVEPIPQYVPNPATWKGKQLEVRELKSEGKGNVLQYPKEILIAVRPYEQLVQKAVEEFLGRHLENRDSNSVPRLDQLLAAEEALSAAVRFHESARQSGRRAGAEWDEVGTSLKRQLFDVLSEQLKVLARAREFDEAFDLAQRLSDDYPDKQAEVAKPLADLLLQASNSALGSDQRLHEVRQQLQLLERKFPESADVRQVTERLRSRAKELFDEAQILKRDNKIKEAQENLTRAEKIWPGLPGLHAFRVRLTTENPILRVGVRDLPKYLSPCKTASDADRRAVELMFEGLVKLSPDSSGLNHYQPALAEGRPVQVPLGRRFQLPVEAKWSNGDPVSSKDVRYSVGLVTKGRLPGWWDVLEQAEMRGPPQLVKLTLHQGVLEPLAPMTFKIVPANSNPDKPDFYKQPVVSGPFEYRGRTSDSGRECASFVASNNYGLRPNRIGLPRLQEIRFFVYKGATGKDVAEEFKPGGIDLALDLTATQFAELKKAPPAGVKLLGPMPTRRVWFLAVNQRRQDLQNADFRLALARAINREDLLNKHFRSSGAGAAHAALNGPFPADSWACNPKLKPRADKPSLDPYDPNKARAFWEKAAAAGVPGKLTLSLKYSRDEPGVEEAMKDLSEQLKKEFPDLTLNLEPRDGRTLHDEVEVTHSYDLAYYHYDFPDDSYNLWPLLGPGPVNQPNYLGYVPGGDVQAVLQECRSRRNFTEVQKYAHVLHDYLLSKEMPLIPLWSLDAFAAVRDTVEHPRFDPLLVFTDAEQWKLKSEGAGADNSP